MSFVLFILFVIGGFIMGGIAIGRCISETQPFSNNRTTMLLKDVQFDIYIAAFFCIVFYGSHEYLIAYLTSKFVTILWNYDEDIEDYELFDRN